MSSKILTGSKVVVKVNGKVLETANYTSITIEYNTCTWCSKSTDIRCVSCHKKGCKKCLHEHFETKMISKDVWPEMIEKIK